MKSTRSARLLTLLSLLAVGLLALADAAHAQKALHDEEGPRIEEPQPFFSVVFEGIVLGPDGAPAVGAVVVSSAGGKAVTDQDGAYRLEIQAPLEAESVQVTAVATVAGGGSLTASTSVGLLASRLARVGPLVLATSTTCQPSWLPTFGGFPGSTVSIRALRVFDDGSGPALYAAGWFANAGGGAVAKWDGFNWSPLGSGMNGIVNALTAFDDGNGPALYAGGYFTTAGGIPASMIARWNGSHWSAVGSGFSCNGTCYFGTTPGVLALAEFDDGSGPALYAGGYFTTAGSVAVNRIARWDGASWSALGSGVASVTGTPPRVLALAVFDDGSGPALYVGGTFKLAGGVSASRIARWDGTGWSALGSGVSACIPCDQAVLSLAVVDDGSGPALFVGGAFSTAGGVAASNIAKWNGSSWAALGSGMNDFVLALTVFDDGSGPALYAGGPFSTAGGGAASQIAMWTGSSWSALGSGLTDGTVGAMTVFDDGSGPALTTAGNFITAGGAAANGIAGWDGSSWSSPDIPDRSGLNSSVRALAVYDDGGGPALYAGGAFTTVGSVIVNHVAKWDGSSWSALDVGTNDEVLALTVFDDGGGPALHAGGAFTAAGGATALRVAKWDGSSWSPLGVGTSGHVSALTVFDDGGGPALYAGGGFSAAGGATAVRIAKWNGSSWSALGSGITDNGVFNYVFALAVFDDGNGPALYAGGEFTGAGGVAASNIARWNGSSWSPLGSGVGIGTDIGVRALKVFDDGNGPALYAAGDFSYAGGIPANLIARWDGATWSALDSGLGGSVFTVHAMTVFEDGSGPALYAGGEFTTAGGAAASRIAKWNGSSWSALGSGMNSTVRALAVFDDGSGPALCAGGDFLSAPDSHDSYLAEWGCDTTPPVLSCPTSVFAGESFGGSPGEIVTFEVTATDVHDTSPTIVCVPASGSLFPHGTTLVTCTATDDAGNVSTCDFPVVVQPKVHRPAKTPRGE